MLREKQKSRFKPSTPEKQNKDGTNIAPSNTDLTEAQVAQPMEETDKGTAEGKSTCLSEALSKAKHVLSDDKRAAARAALDAMEKEVVIDNNLKVMSEFKKMICGDDEDGVGSQKQYWGDW
ncbi:hypothetical protein ACFE04_029190 [Oxalis oulophora]